MNKNQILVGQMNQLTSEGNWRLWIEGRYVLICGTLPRKLWNLNTDPPLTVVYVFPNIQNILKSHFVKFIEVN